MRVVIQRVSEASVEIEGEIQASIHRGFLILLGIEESDSQEDALWLSNKILSMRVFCDDMNKMNLDIQAVHGECLVVSQFTLHASTKKGNRPSFIRAARPETAKPLYEQFLINLAERSGLVVKAGVFGADMKVALVNDGPVTIWMDSKNRE